MCDKSSGGRLQSVVKHGSSGAQESRVQIWPLRRATLFSLVLLGASAVTQAQAVSDFIRSERTIDWTQAGIPGGIPDASWPICQTIPPSSGADDSVTIQNAINSCAAGSVVVLTAGTYTLHRTTGTVCVGKTDDYATGVYEAGLCLTDKSIVLRGAGPTDTILKYGDGASIISMGETYLSSPRVTFISVTSTAQKGSNPTDAVPGHWYYCQQLYRRNADKSKRY